ECESLKVKLIEQSRTLKEEQAELGTRNELVFKKSQEADKESAHLSSVLKEQSHAYERDAKLLNDKENGLSGLRSDLDLLKSNLTEIHLKVERHQMSLSTLSDRL